MIHAANSIIRMILSVIRFWLGLNTLLISTLGAFGERFSRIVSIAGFVGLIVATIHTDHLWTRVLLQQFFLAVLVIVGYLIRMGIKTKYLRILPSSLPTALLVSFVLGSNIGSQLREHLSTRKITVRDLIAPVYEVHLKLGATPTREGLEEVTRRLSKRYRGALFYTYSPMAVAGLLRKAGMEPTISLNSPTKIDPRRAQKYQHRNKPSKFYLFKMP